MDNEPLAQIVSAAREGSQQAYRELVARFGSGLLGYFYRNTGHRSDSEDLVQDLFVRVVRGLPKYTEKERFEVWLYQVAHHLLIDYWRKRKIQYSAEAWVLDQEVTDRASSGEDDELQQALHRLPPEQRDAILMRYFSGLPFEKIAKTTGVPIGTALARVHRGLGRLRELLIAKNPEETELSHERKRKNGTTHQRSDQTDRPIPTTECR